MRILTDIKALKDFRLECVFNDGTRKIADITPFLSAAAFQPLTDYRIFFSALRNEGTFVEWKDYDIDLSADTLWHIAVDA
jgi:hypothetical protein